MKTQILDSKANKSKEISTDIFDAPIREDIIQKIAEAEKIREQREHPFAPYKWSGMETSASGNVKHNRHVWKTDRGKGMSRFPKKRMSDKGERFVWVGAVVPGTRGGRRAHPPKLLRKDFKINKKEYSFALKSALALISSNEKLKEKYSFDDKKLKLPLIFDSSVLSLKTKDFFSLLIKIYGEELSHLVIKNRKTRPGVGKMRGRRYKENAGLILVIGDKEEKKVSGIDYVKAKDIKVMDIASNGPRLVAFTEEAVKDLENKLEGKKSEGNKK